jgi:hypothetical protein
MKPLSDNIFELIGYQPASHATIEYSVSQIAAAYAFPAAGGIQMEVVSSDNTNDKVAGTGALTVEIGYLNASYQERKEIVTVNGTTEVATVATDIFRVNSFRVLTAGTLGAAAGKIDLRAVANTPIYATIAIGQTEARQIIYTVPAGKRLIIDEMYLSNTAATALKYTNVALKSSIAPGSVIFQNRFLIGLDQFPLPAKLENPIVIGEKRDVKMVTWGVAAGIVCATIRGRMNK